MPRPTKLTLAAVVMSAALPATALSDDRLHVYSYASQVNDVDAVNSHWFETSDGVVLIDAQRLLPEAERALKHVRATTSKPVVAIVVSHAHTDHYGGLPVWLEAFPEAKVITDATTLSSIREDRRGFIEMRNDRHGERFPTQEALNDAVSEAHVVADGDKLTFGGHTVSFTVLGASEAESTVVTEIIGEDTAFIGDLVNVGIPAVPFESLDTWLDQLDGFEARFDGDDHLHIGHGPSPVGVADLPEQRRYLEALRSHVVNALAEDGAVSGEEADDIVFRLEAEWPFYEGVAGNTRREVLRFSVGRVTGQLGGEFEPANDEG